MSKAKLSRRHILSIFAIAVALPKLAVATPLPQIKAFRNPGCGCCEKWAAMLQQAGFTIEMVDDADLAARKSDAGVPIDATGCHTAFMGEYVIEGHVPLAEIMRLVNEKPPILGLAVAGMPQGSQGMESDTSEKYDVLSFTKDGNWKVFASY
jgi:hypothetical protein